MFSAADADIEIKFSAEDTVTHSVPPETQGIYSIKGYKSCIEAVSSFSLLRPEFRGFYFEVGATNITRLDLGVMWALYYDDKYAEIPLSSQPKGDSLDPAAGYTWDFNISPIEKQKKIKKLVCVGQIGKVVGVSNDDPADTVFISFELWQSDDSLFGGEFSAYQDHYAEVSGRHRLWAQRHLGTYLKGEYRTVFERLTDMMGGIGCIPMKYVASVDRTVKYLSAGYAVSNTGRRVPISRVGKGIRPPKGDYWKLVRFTSEITGIKHKNIDDEKFEIPSNYTKINPDSISTLVQ
jgi:hypothetical protein